MRLSATPLPESKTFPRRGYNIAYRDVGEGSRVIVLTHGLLMNSHLFTKLARVLADAGNRVILVDMLGHGDSDQPEAMDHYSMSRFGKDIIALLDHLGVEQAVIGGTSLGANVSLEAAVAAPERVRALFIEMPVLEHGIAAVGGAFVPLALSFRLAPLPTRALAAVARLVPRTHWLVDVLLDTVRRNPRASLAVLDGLAFGRIAPPRELRQQLTQPALVIGHAADPIHPFSDADELADEMPNAQLVEAWSIVEWRVMPKRLDGELLRFLDEVWSRPQAVVRASA